jgi:predicted nucleotidyltransferase
LRFGLTKKDLESIVHLLQSKPEINKAVLFGSRAKGNFKRGSDVDIAIFGEQVNLEIVSRLSWELNELTSLPYMFDIVDYTHLPHPELKEHIDRVGILLFSRDNAAEQRKT